VFFNIKISDKVKTKIIDISGLIFCTSFLINILCLTMLHWIIKSTEFLQMIKITIILCIISGIIWISLMQSKSWWNAWERESETVPDNKWFRYK